jgi:hypothetical protein
MSGTQSLSRTAAIWGKEGGREGGRERGYEEKKEGGREKGAYLLVQGIVELG